jgi:hypothetical protein
VKNTCIKLYTCLTACRLYILLPNNAAGETFLHKWGEKSELLTVHIYHCGSGLAASGRIRDIGQNVLNLICKLETVDDPVTSIFSSLSHSSGRPLLSARSKAWVCGLSLDETLVSYPAGACISVCCECYVLSTGLFDGLITRPE